MLYRSLIICLMLMAFAAPGFAVGDDAPSWLRQAAAARVPEYEKDVPGLVLINESRLTVGDDGKVTTISTFAVRILTREGRILAQAKQFYQTDSGKVREMRAWLIRVAGDARSYGKDETLDAASVGNDIYNESRYKLIDASSDADAGMVFGYEKVTEERSDFNQTVWGFQGRLPVLLSRIALTLPSHWRASSVAFNHESIEPVVTGTTYSWELRNLPHIQPEPASPELTNLVPRIAISYYPAEGARSNRSPTFENWTAVSRWYTELIAGQDAASDLLTAKVRQLTGGLKTDLEKIQAIARYAQDIQYISILMGAGRLRPHAASDVFVKSYGDCKDKANLMRAMLKTINISSYLVLIHSGDPTYVREEWASPSWFNHCIIAIKVTDETQAPTVITHPSIGRLLIFDATNENTPVGDLPYYLQGSFALVAAGDNGALLRMPTTSPEANILDRHSNVVLAPDGTITATVRDRALGQTAVAFRREFRSLSRLAYVDMIEKWITRNVNGAKVTKIEPVDNRMEGRFSLELEFTASGYGQLMQDRLLVFRPAIVQRRDPVLLPDTKRQYPIVLQPSAYNETVSVKLPAGFEVDELPDAMKLDSSFGTFSAGYEIKDGNLVYTRSLVQRASTIPPKDYAKVKIFYDGMRKAEQSPVVLARSQK